MLKIMFSFNGEHHQLIETENDLLNGLLSAFEGNPFNNQVPLNWLEYAASLPIVSLEDAKARQLNKRDQLRKLIN